MEYDPNQPDPLRALGLPPGASQQDVKRVYRQLLKQYRPERDPEGFQRLRQVFEDAMEVAALESDASIGSRSHSPLDAIESAFDQASSDVIELSEEELLEALRSQNKHYAFFEDVSQDLDAGLIDEAMAKLKRSQEKWAPEDPETWVLGIVSLAQQQLPEHPDTCRLLLGQATTTTVDAGPAFDQLEQTQWSVKVCWDLIAGESDSAIYTPLVYFLRDSLFVDVAQASLGDLVTLQQAAINGKWDPAASFARMRASLPHLYSAWRGVVEQNTVWLEQLDTSYRHADHPQSIQNRTERLSKRLRSLRDPTRVTSQVPAVLASITVSPYALWAIKGRMHQGIDGWIYVHVFFGVVAITLLTALYDSVRKFFYLRQQYLLSLKQFNDFGVPMLTYLVSVDFEPPDIVSGALATLETGGKGDAFDLSNLGYSLTKALARSS